MKRKRLLLAAFCLLSVSHIRGQDNPFISGDGEATDQSRVEQQFCEYVSKEMAWKVSSPEYKSQVILD